MTWRRRPLNAALWRGVLGPRWWPWLLALLLWLCVAGGAWADIVGGPAAPVLVYRYAASVGTPWGFMFYVPDPSNSQCPVGQWSMWQAVGQPPSLDPLGEDLGAQGGWPYFAACQTNSMLGVWTYFSGVGLVSGAMPQFFGPSEFSCGEYAYLDQASGNCLVPAGDPVEFASVWGWGFGVVAVCGLLGWIGGLIMRFVNDTSQA